MSNCKTNKFTKAADYEAHPRSKLSEVRNFREYLRIPSVQPDINYDGCVEFLRKQAVSLGLPIRIYEHVPTKPIVIITWVGSEQNLPTVLLNSHMDVVPVFEESWTYPPFGAEMDEQGNIYARGAQDMKCVGIQYLEAIRRLKNAGVTNRRTIHISFVPDEEIGGVNGMKKFVETDDFRALNIGFSLDEGIASPGDDYELFYGERTIWHLHIHCPGTPGHGSLLLPDTAGEKVQIILNKFMDYRAKEKKKLEDNPNLSIGDVTTINVTKIYGGVQANVVPPQLSVVFDIRLAVTENVDAFEKMVKKWCEEAGSGVEMEFEQKDPFVDVTHLDPGNPWWVAFKNVTNELNLDIKQRIFPGGTDSRFVRGVGLPAIGFSPMNNTPVLLHDHNEYLNVDIFLNGISIYEKLIPAVANVEDRTG